MSEILLSEQEILRRNSLTELRNLGIDPYPAEEFPVNCTSIEILENYDAEKNNTISEKDQALRVYSILTDLYTEKPFSIINYIDMPKENGYKSLHCKLMILQIFRYKKALLYILLLPI